MIVLALAVALGCAGGDEPRDNGAAVTPPSDGQPDYRERALQILVIEPFPDLSSGRSPEEVAAELAQRSSDWDDLEPPGALAGAHQRLGDALRDVLGYLGRAVQKTAAATPNAAERQIVREVLDAHEQWSSEFESHYGVIAPFRVEGSAMEPAFCSGDMLTLEVFDGTLERWQVIVFKFPLDEDRDFIKRVVGLPGETIEVRDGAILIDGSPLGGDVYAKAPPNYTVAPLRIPQGRYYVLGDNRRNSYDSHVWAASGAGDPVVLSTVPANLIEGELPLEASGCLDAAQS